MNVSCLDVFKALKVVGDVNFSLNKVDCCVIVLVFVSGDVTFSQSIDDGVIVFILVVSTLSMPSV